MSGKVFAEVARLAISAAAPTTTRLALILALGFAANGSAPLFAYTPESPQVKKAIQKGIAYLAAEGTTDSKPGAYALMGIALLENDVKPDHPKILLAAQKVKDQIPDNDPKKATIENIYNAGLSIIFLCTLDPQKYKPEIECLLQFLYDKQKKHGGWGYYMLPTGDTSMTQYGVLSSWKAKSVGFYVPPDAMDGVTNWLLRTQDPSGGYGYQGILANEGALVPQNDVRQSMTAAGAGCLFILADLFNFDVVTKTDGPSALKEVRGKLSKNPNAIKTNISPKALREAQIRANEWFWTKKNYTINPEFGFQYYYMYALERYMSFRDLIEQNPEKEPKWYNEGIDYILAHEGDKGGWEGGCGRMADTAFAMLFMCRATKKIIAKAKNYGAGALISGYGLPKKGERIETIGGRVVVKPDFGPAEDLLKMLDDPQGTDYEKAMEMMSELPSQQLETLFAAHGDKLRQLTRDQEPEARLAAVVALAKTRNLDHVPALIYALSDPDKDVVIEARKALERISRNPQGFGPPDDFNEEQRRAAAEKWKAWYRSLRPDADVDF
jgi:hypothetical protein